MRLHVSLNAEDLEVLEELARVRRESRSETIRWALHEAHRSARAAIAQHRRFLARQLPLPGVTRGK
jgi:metal-responsive CopG/Arc/MetJ family transcriptional regulator